MQAHSEHCVGPPNQSHNEGGVLGRLQHRAGDPLRGDHVRDLPADAAVFDGLHRQQNWLQPIGVGGIDRRLGKIMQMRIRTRPGAKGQNQQPILGPDAVRRAAGHNQLRRGRLDQKGHIRRDAGRNAGDAEALQLLPRSGVPEGDAVHIVLNDPCGTAAVHALPNGTDAAAEHHDPVSQTLRRANGVQIIPKRAGRGGILDQTAAAGEIEGRAAHAAADLPGVESEDTADADIPRRLIR